MFKKPHNVADIEDIGSRTKAGLGMAVSNKRKRGGVSSDFSQSQDSQGDEVYKTWREILGAPPPIGFTKVCTVLYVVQRF